MLIPVLTVAVDSRTGRMRPGPTVLGSNDFCMTAYVLYFGQSTTVASSSRK